MRGLFEGAVYSRARSIRGCSRIVRARSINFTVCVMRGLFEGAVYSEGTNYSRKYGKLVCVRTDCTLSLINDKCVQFIF